MWGGQGDARSQGDGHTNAKGGDYALKRPLFLELIEKGAGTNHRRGTTGARGVNAEKLS
jgi:hypothetical protein